MIFGRDDWFEPTYGVGNLLYFCWRWRYVDVEVGHRVPSLVAVVLSLPSSVEVHGLNFDPALQCLSRSGRPPPLLSLHTQTRTQTHAGVHERSLPVSTFACRFHHGGVGELHFSMASFTFPLRLTTRIRRHACVTAIANSVQPPHCLVRVVVTTHNHRGLFGTQPCSVRARTTILRDIRTSKTVAAATAVSPATP